MRELLLLNESMLLSMYTAPLHGNCYTRLGAELLPGKLMVKVITHRS